MIGQKKVHFRSDLDYRNLIRKIENLDILKPEKSAMIKDAHLISAAKATDNIVVSLDDNSRRLFAGASKQITDLAGIHWINPNEDYEELITWLEQGALPKDDLKLGS